jgi:hypothetical protein
MSFVNRQSVPWILAGALSFACGREPEAVEPSPPAAESPTVRAEEKAELPEDVKKGLAEVAAVAEEAPEDPSVLQETGELVSPVLSELSSKFPG